MTTLLENPLPIIFFGVIVMAVLAAVAVTYQRGVVLLAMLGVLLLVAGGVVLERLVVTEVERVEASLDGVAAALEANDLNGALQYVSPSADQTRSRAGEVLRWVRFTEVKVNSLEITINDLTSPPTAEAKFTGVFHFQDRTGKLFRESYAMGLTVELRLEGDRWLITNHIEHREVGL